MTDPRTTAETRASTSTDPAELLNLARSYATTRIVRIVAANPHIDDETVGILMADETPVRAALAKNPATGPRHLEVLLKDHRMRSHLAQRPSSPEILRHVYLHGRDEEVVAWLSLNTSTPIDILERIAEDEKAFIRIGLAHSIRGPHTGTILAKLAEDRNPKVRYAATRMHTLLGATG